MSVTKLTDDEILSSIPGLEEFVSEQNASNTEADTNTEGNTTDTAAATSNESGTGNTQTQGNSEGQTGTAQEQVIARRDGLVERPNQDNPRTRDLVDPATGRIVAHGGIERSVFEQAQRHRRENDSLKQRLQTLETQVGGANEVTRVGNQLQLAPQEQVAAVQAFADFKRDPVRFLETLVAEVKSKGFDIPFLSEGINRGIDTAAVQRMLDERLAPITQQQRQVEANTQSYRQAEAELNQFIENFPASQANLDVIGEMLERDPSLTLDRAYVRMVEWAHDNGFDPRQPLKAQVGRAGQQPQQGSAPLQPQQTMPQRATTPTAPLPNGRGTAQAPQREATSTLNETSSWQQIVREAFRENGLQV